jgi:hypothetical protein
MEQLLLLQGVREVSERADPNAPTAVSQRSFDAARAASSFPDLPAARNIAAQLGMAWADVLHIAHAPATARSHRLGRKQTSEEQDWLSEEYVAFVLRLVARRLGKSALSLRDYRLERDCMLRNDRARFIHGGQLVLPNAEQIITRVGSWEEALRLAGMAPSQRARQDARPEHTSAPTICDLLERFYEHYEAQPTARDLKAFASGNGIPYSNERGVRFGEELTAWKAARKTRGLAVPEKPPPLKARADYSRDVGAAREGERRRHKWSDAEQCVTWMTCYLEELPATSRSTMRSYRDWTLRQDGAPAPDTLIRHGGFERIRRLAQERIRTARRPALVEASAPIVRAVPESGGLKRCTGLIGIRALLVGISSRPTSAWLGSHESGRAGRVP